MTISFRRFDWSECKRIKSLIFRVCLNAHIIVCLLNTSITNDVTVTHLQTVMEIIKLCRVCFLSCKVEWRWDLLSLDYMISSPVQHLYRAIFLFYVQFLSIRFGAEFKLITFEMAKIIIITLPLFAFKKNLLCGRDVEFFFRKFHELKWNILCTLEKLIENSK